MGGGWPETPSPKFIFHRMLRRGDLCPGPQECPEVLTFNPWATAESPRCMDCPLTLLDEYLAKGGGQLIGQVIDLDFALQAGVTISSSEITYQEFLLLRQLADERQRYQEETMKKASRHGR
jgi:hypothetical protein